MAVFNLIFVFVLSLNSGALAFAEVSYVPFEQQMGAWPNAISVHEVKAMIDSQTAILIDVREQNEIALGMAAPAIWYSKSAIDADLDGFVAFLQSFSDKTIIVYCRSGRRASVVVEMLAQRGIFAYNMGGFQDWLDAGFATKQP